VGTSLEVVTDAQGRARFDGVAAGKYDVAVHLPGFMSQRADITVTGDTPVQVAVSLPEALHFAESVTVTASGRDTFESYQPATVLGGEDLQQKLAPTLGATLQDEPGVNVRSFGAGNERPVIRGLGGDRVLILEDGVRTGDLSSQSADHGVNLDPAEASRIEVVRGPATLLYGSSAIGGVVNVISDEIPTSPVSDVHGSMTAQGATADANGGIAADVTLGNGKLAGRVKGSYQRTSDYHTPDPDLETVPNTFSRAKSGGGSFGYTGQDGYQSLRRTLRRGRRNDIDAPPAQGGFPWRAAQPRFLHRRCQGPGRVPQLPPRRAQRRRYDRYQLREPDVGRPAFPESPAGWPSSGHLRCLGTRPRLRLGG
jgi:iron complex outermembrane receptor protein